MFVERHTWSFRYSSLAMLIPSASTDHRRTSRSTRYFTRNTERTSATARQTIQWHCFSSRLCQPRKQHGQRMFQSLRQMSVRITNSPSFEGQLSLHCLPVHRSTATSIGPRLLLRWTDRLYLWHMYGQTVSPSTGGRAWRQRRRFVAEHMSDSTTQWRTCSPVIWSYPVTENASSWIKGGLSPVRLSAIGSKIRFVDCCRCSSIEPGSMQ